MGTSFAIAGRLNQNTQIYEYYRNQDFSEFIFKQNPDKTQINEIFKAHLEELSKMFVAVEDFRNDISSTELRNNKNKE